MQGSNNIKYIKQFVFTILSTTDVHSLSPCVTFNDVSRWSTGCLSNVGQVPAILPGASTKHTDTHFYITTFSVPRT